MKRTDEKPIRVTVAVSLYVAPHGREPEAIVESITGRVRDAVNDGACHAKTIVVGAIGRDETAWRTTPLGGAVA